MADESREVCLRTSRDERNLTAAYVSHDGEVVCMQFITRGKKAQSHADVAPSCLLHDALYQDHGGKEVETGATFERLLTNLPYKAGRMRE